MDCGMNAFRTRFFFTFLLRYAYYIIMLAFRTVDKPEGLILMTIGSVLQLVYLSSK